MFVGSKIADFRSTLTRSSSTFKTTAATTMSGRFHGHKVVVVRVVVVVVSKYLLYTLVSLAIREVTFKMFFFIFRKCFFISKQSKNRRNKIESEFSFYFILFFPLFSVSSKQTCVKNGLIDCSLLCQLI